MLAAVHAAIVDSALDGIIAIDHEGEILEFNSAASQIFGVRREEVLGLKLSEVIVPERLRGAHSAGMRHYLKTGEGPALGNRVEVPGLHADGSEIPIELSIVAVHRENAPPIFTAHVRDLSERVEAERQLNQARLMLDQQIDAVFWIGTDGQFKYVNDAACTALGFGRDELVGMSVFAIDETMTLELWPGHIEELEDVRRLSIESVHRRRDGSTFPVEVGASLIEMEHETFVCAVVRDLTERRESEARINDALAASLAASRAKNLFVANMSHEIRTPLSAMLGYSELIADRGGSDPDLLEWTRVIRSNGGYLDRILCDLLDISRIESGDLELRDAECDLREVLALELSNMRPRAERRGLELRVEIPAPIPCRFRTDAARLQQVLSNLLSNAIKYTPAGTVSLRLEASPPDATEPRLKLIVKDTGIGIPSDRIEEVFQPFGRIQTSSEQSVEGVGLGLAIVQRLTSMLGGELRIESRIGGGTTATAELVVHDASEWVVPEPAELALALADPNEEEFRPLKLRGRVLVVDDAEDLARLFLQWLEAWGLDWEYAKDGAEAVQRASVEPYDLILMDWRMAGQDGLSATRALRRRGIVTPIIALTAHAGQAAEAECLEAGCNAYLTKPVDGRRLYRTIQPFLMEASTSPRPGQAQSLAPISDLTQLRARFLEQLTTDVQAMSGWFAAADHEQLRSVAHRIKGSAGSFGYDEVSVHAARLERCLVHGQHDSLHERLRDLYEAVRTAG